MEVCSVALQSLTESTPGDLRIGEVITTCGPDGKHVGRSYCFAISQNNMTSKIVVGHFIASSAGHFSAMAKPLVMLAAQLSARTKPQVAGGTKYWSKQDMSVRASPGAGGVLIVFNNPPQVRRLLQRQLPRDPSPHLG